MLSDSNGSNYKQLLAGHYLTALRGFRQEYVSPEKTRRDFYNLKWALNSVDPWGSAWEITGSGNPLPSNPGPLLEPKEVITEAMSRHRVVILMEVDIWPETRYYGARLLAALRSAGATHLALDTHVGMVLGKFEQTGVVRPDLALYAIDPSWANLFRTARGLGLKIVEVDFSPDPDFLKENFPLPSTQKVHTPDDLIYEQGLRLATNIVRLILERASSARVVLLVGEWPGLKGHLARLTGEEPYVVYQECVNLPELSAGPKLTRGDLGKWRGDGVDGVILHHRGENPAMPEWIREGTVTLEIEARGAELVQAIPAQEGELAVPAAQWLVQGETIQAALKPGHYLLRGVAGPDSILWQYQARV